MPRAPTGLTYVNDKTPGLTRRRAGKGFSYRNARGRPVRDCRTLARIRALAIPPAWTDVWICASPNGHLQATGRDARGRKQHRYHSRYRAVRDNAKFERIACFASALPAIRATVLKHLRRKALPREKVLAAIVHLLDTTLIRVGNDEYVRCNGSYGLTTLRDQHAQIQGSQLRFVFKGKSGKRWRLTLRDRRVAGIVKATQELPGQRLFQYEDEAGDPQRVTSSDVNAYLRQIGGADVSAKDFRTWGGTVLAAASLTAFPPPDSASVARANVKAAVERVALTLGNTATIARKCYIHPRLIDAYEAGELRLPRARRIGLTPHEASVLAFLAPRALRRGMALKPSPAFRPGAGARTHSPNGVTGRLGPTTILGSSSKPG